MYYHKRHLPHYYPPEATLFLMWRLFGSLAGLREPETSVQDAGRVFAQSDHMLDIAGDGPLLLEGSTHRSGCGRRPGTGRKRISPVPAVCVGHHAQPRACRYAAIAALASGNEMDQWIHLAFCQPTAQTNRPAVLAIRNLLSRNPQ